MKLEATKELVEMINLSAREWKSDPNRIDVDKHFDSYCEREYGLKVDFSTMGNAVIVESATVTDEEKYINFLLRFGNMHDE